jgi:hypothetical protein
LLTEADLEAAERVSVDHGDVRDLLSQADLMLYDAKGAGRNRHAVLDPAARARQGPARSTRR